MLEWTVLAQVCGGRFPKPGFDQLLPARNFDVSENLTSRESHHLVDLEHAFSVATKISRAHRTFRFVAEPYRQPKAKCNTFLQRKLLGFSLRFLVVRKRSFAQC
jgi:hypothetical protein